MKTISTEQFRDGARDVVLKALDKFIRELTDCDKALGAHDSDLPELFAALDAHMDRVAARFNTVIFAPTDLSSLRDKYSKYSDDEAAAILANTNTRIVLAPQTGK